jgi:hypothetical protein
MREQPYNDLSLFDQSGCRKYLNAAERLRFIKKAECAVPDVRLFCLVLGWSGVRISEVLALTPATIDLEIGVANFRTLKRRKAGFIRQVPCLTICLMTLSAVLICEPGSATPLAPTSAFGRGAAQQHGGPSSSLWPRPTSGGRAPHQRACGTASASMPFNPMCRRILFNAGLVTRLYGRLLYIYIYTVT